MIVQINRLFLAIYLSKSEIILILYEIHNYAGYFGFRILLNYPRFWIFWFKMAFNICQYK